MPEQLEMPSISAAEADALTMNAFLGALDDHVQEFNSNDEKRRNDTEIMASIAGMRDTASEYYNPLLVGQLNLMQLFDQRLEAMCMLHGEFGAAYNSYQAEQTDTHVHIPGDEHEEPTKDTKKKKKKEVKKYGTWTATKTKKTGSVAIWPFLSR